jgi:hypothetical protein
MAGGNLDAVGACQALPRILKVAGLRPGELRLPVIKPHVRQGIDWQARQPGDPDSWAGRAVACLAGKSRAIFKPSPVYTMANLMPQAGPKQRPAFAAPPGRLCAHFESGPDGVSSVGHSPGAGTSYGLFQIASGRPTYGNFLKFLEERAPDWYKRLSRGPADTGGTDGAVPKEWRSIAAEDPKRFERLQYEFILNTHYRPAVQEIWEETGVDVSALSPAIREVLWSAVVQHGLGGGSEIFVTAIEAIKPLVLEKPDRRLLEHTLIEEVYKGRLKVVDSRPLIKRAGMENRYEREMSQALNLLDRDYLGS